MGSPSIYVADRSSVDRRLPFPASSAAAKPPIKGRNRGGDDDPEEAEWVGNWTRTGTQATTCGTNAVTTQLNGLVVITPGAMPNSAVTVGGLSVTVTGTQGSATLNGNIITGTEAGSTNNGCSFNQQFTLTKM